MSNARDERPPSSPSPSPRRQTPDELSDGSSAYDSCEDEMTRFIREDHSTRPLYRPWLEENNPIAYPPDINYGHMIAADQEKIDQILENPRWHFQEKCLRYQDQDIEVERWILMAYHEWAEFMGRASTSKDRAGFFKNLEIDVAGDLQEVRKERDMRVHKTAERGQTIYARQGMPIYQWCMCRMCFDKRIEERNEREEKRKGRVRGKEENELGGDGSDGYITADADTPYSSPV